MNSTLHSFKDIFKTTFGEDKTKLQKIIIPIIQRDYAQGRLVPEIDRVRSRFLDSLHDAVTSNPSNPITLDFVYGDIDDNGVMTPLDGQQRLTTLFLLYWYAAKKGGIADEECGFLSNFGYETRYSARYFCEELTKFKPAFKDKLSAEIIDQAWFPLDWQKDPTISSMLVMLDSISEKFDDVQYLWEKLAGGAVTFYFLPIKDMGLTDELYIKLNSRGKPLTKFEHFKAELERCISSFDDNKSKAIMRKIDRDWTDLLWKYRDNGVIIDDEFLRYFRFICDVICYQSGQSPQNKSTDEFDMLTEYFSGDSNKVQNNIAVLEEYFDCWCRINSAELLKTYIAHEHDGGKIVVDRRYEIDIFRDCLHSYADKNGRLRQFPLNRIVLLYAITCFLRNRDKVSDDDFKKRLRCVNNLIQNSEDEISDRAGNNRIPAILKQTDAVMLTGTIDDTIANSFNVHQIAEEKAKKAFLDEHPEQSENVFILEDHFMLKGQISIVGLDHLDYAKRFVSLFGCDWDLIDCALMSTGDYGQQEKKGRWQYASKSMQIAWDRLFHKGANVGFDNTKTVLAELLSKSESFTDDILKKIANDFVADCERVNVYPWRYYYVKYDVFRPGSYGKYSNDDAKSTPYMFSVMQTQSYWSSNTYMPYLKAADDAHLDKDSMGQRLVYGDKYVVCDNAEYKLCENETVVDTKKINQNEKIDTEDRILLLKDFIKPLI